jgi:surface polysaccharide O-acyltransferase-like enzyme
MQKTSWLEVLRIAATSAVIGIHILADMVGASYLLGSKRWWLANLVAGSLRWSVPIFIVVSGYVLLSQRQSVIVFYQKRLRRLAIPLIFWTLFYLGWTQILATHYAQPLTARDLGNLVLNGVPYYHLWYLYMLVGLYLVTPLLGQLLTRLSKTQTTWLCFSMLLLAVLSSSWFSLARVHFIFWFLPFLGYFLFGYWLCHEEVAVPSWSLGVTVVLMMALTTLGSYFEARQLSTNFGAYMYGYLSPNVMIMALAIIMIFKKSAVFWQSYFESYPRLQRLADSSFVVYLLHPFLLDLLRLAVPIARFHPVLSVLLIPVVFIAVSWLAGVIFRRIPYARYLG